MGRLTEVTYPNSDVEAFTYDANGNGLTYTLNSVLQHSYSYDAAGQLLSDGVGSYSHDAAGNLTAAGSDSFSWDWANRLTSATVASTTETYAYDGDNVRVSSTANSTTTPYLWDRLGGVERLVDDGTQGYVHADGLLAAIDGTDTTYAMPDRLGSVRGLVDETETVIGTADYAAFGDVRSQTGVSSVFGFTGEQTDAATGSVFLRARYLSPTLGRFLSADTVQPNAPGSQGYNLYGYVANNPATWIDPSGHEAAVAQQYLLPAWFSIGLAWAYAVLGAACALGCFLLIVAIIIIAVILAACLVGVGGICWGSKTMERERTTPDTSVDTDPRDWSDPDPEPRPREAFPPDQVLPRSDTDTDRRYRDCEEAARNMENWYPNLPLEGNSLGRKVKDQHGPPPSRYLDDANGHFSERAWTIIDWYFEQTLTQGMVYENPGGGDREAECVAMFSSQVEVGVDGNGNPSYWIYVLFSTKPPYIHSMFPADENYY